MLIESSVIAMGVRHESSRSLRESVVIEVNPGPGAAAAEDGRPGRRIGQAPDGPSIPSTGAASDAAETGATGAGNEDDQLSGELRLLKAIVQQLTGRLMEVFDEQDMQEADDGTGAETAPTRDGGPALRVTVSREYAESESMQFGAAGTVRTADGREINFAVSLSMQRSYVERSQVQMEFGSAPRLKDPLVINFDGQAASLSDGRYEFDLDADGEMDRIPGLSSGRAFLVLDRNGNGRVDDGSELFGALSGNGYADLRQLDSDGNGFIDEGDPVFAKLGVWRPEVDGIRSLASTGVGALATSAAETPFKLTDAGNQQTGQVRGSSIYLTESGRVGTTQQLDLVV